MKQEIPLFRAYVHCVAHHLENGKWVDKWVLGDVSIYYDRKRGVRVQDGSITGNHDYRAGDDCFLMKFTGVFDKHGIPVYEKDIIRGRWKAEEVTSHMMMSVCPELGPSSFHYYSELEDMDFEVIGNLYEDYTLLGVKSLQDVK